MIINTGQRTDIPAFYPRWFINRINAGYVMVRNPYYPSLVTRFTLSPDVVDIIGFCSKNPRPLFPYLDQLKQYKQFWYITITGFESDIEKNVPSIDDVICSFQHLSKHIGSNAIGLRYTPIIVTDKYSVQRHIETFEYITSKLEGYTSLTVFGFLDVYDKLKRYHPELKDTSDENKINLALKFQDIAKSHHMELRLCSKEKYLQQYGIDVSGCMRLEDYERAGNFKLKPDKKMNARKGFCSCFLSNDIGSYNSCLHLCSYCYANGSKEAILRNFRNHDDNSPFLIGNSLETDVVRVAKQKSWIIKEGL